MEIIQKLMIETYQCPGCVVGGDISCFEPSETLACGKHVPGTMGFPTVGRFFLGLPKGFCRFKNDQKIHIYKDVAGKDESNDWTFDKYNVPVWKHIDKHGNTLVRGYCPRIDYTWIHIYIGDKTEVIDCIEIMQSDIEFMD